jgi:hypothetical protein
VKPVYPTAHEVAVAITTAAHVFEESPIDLATGHPRGYARWIAYAVLLELFPTVPCKTIEGWLGDRKGFSTMHARKRLADRKKHGTWNKQAESVVRHAVRNAMQHTERAWDLADEALEPDAPEPALAPPVTVAKLIDVGRAARVQRMKDFAVAAKPTPLRSSKPLFTPTIGVDLTVRPDAPIDPATLLTSQLMGDPSPLRSALAQREREARKP